MSYKIEQRVRGGHWVLTNEYRDKAAAQHDLRGYRALMKGRGLQYRIVKTKPRRNPYPGIRAQVRCLPSGQVQLKVPLKRGESPLAKARQVAKSLGRKITSVAWGGRKRNPSRGEVDTVAARELELYVENDGALYRQQYTPINKKLATKMARGVYDHAKAVKLFMYLMESGAKKYAKEFSTSQSDWPQIFSVPTRKYVAERFADHFEAEYRLGNYDHLLPKKYQKR